MTVASPGRLQNFTEVVDFGIPFAEANVEGTVIHNVKLLGAVSTNGRVYSARALADAARLYDGVRIMVDHPTDSEMMDRGGVREFDVLIGQARNTRVKGNSVRGDVVLLDGEPRTPKLLSLARDMPTLAGFSHRARGTIEVDDEGIQHVLSLEEVAAVELVTQPATSDGLFESDDSTHAEVPEMEIKDLTLAQLKDGNPGLLESITAGVVESLKGDEVLNNLRAELATAQASLKEANTKLDAAEATNRATQHMAMVARVLTEAGLHPSVVTEQFKKDLAQAADEAAVTAMVEDRKLLASKIEGGLIEAAEVNSGPKSSSRSLEDVLSDPKKAKPITGDVLAQASSKLF